jgi:electron transfer flavoprotein beta subunit
MVPAVVSVGDLGLSAADLAPSVELVRRELPVVNGNCQFLEGPAAAAARQLIERLRADGAI